MSLPDYLLGPPEETDWCDFHQVVFLPSYGCHECNADMEDLYADAKIQDEKGENRSKKKNSRIA